MQTTLQAVVTPQGKMDANPPMKLALFNQDGTPFSLDTTPDEPAEAVPDSEATTILGLVSDFNDLLASLRAAGFIAE